MKASMTSEATLPPQCQEKIAFFDGRTPVKEKKKTNEVAIIEST